MIFEPADGLQFLGFIPETVGGGIIGIRKPIVEVGFVVAVVGPVGRFGGGGGRGRDAVGLKVGGFGHILAEQSSGDQACHRSDHGGDGTTDCTEGGSGDASAEGSDTGADGVDGRSRRSGVMGKLAVLALAGHDKGDSCAREFLRVLLAWTLSTGRLCVMVAALHAARLYQDLWLPDE